MSAAATATATVTATAAASPSYLDALFSPLDALAGLVTYRVLGIARGSTAGKAVRFFLYDTPKVLLLLVSMVFVVAVIRSFFPPEKTRARLEGLPPGLGNVLAAFLGVLTPF